MKPSKLVLVICLVLLALVGCTGTGTTSVPENEPAVVLKVSPQEAYNLIQDNVANPGFVILDVRTPGEFADGHLPAAVNLDYNSANFPGEISRLDSEKVYLVYCRTGIRSAAASALMAKNGFSKVYDMTGGITAWQAAGFAVVK